MLNQIVLIGRLTKDPELKIYFNNGEQVLCRFVLAVGRPKTKNQAEITDFINCVVFHKMAENLEKFMKKGALSAVSGQLQVRSYKENGENRYFAEVNVRHLTFLKNKENKEKENTELLWK
ncbi:MAG: single-stranded DNA-binding protein [Vigna little leaf phytoplasma]|nr:single-stranded DNA-binding protein [Vigna little leaf phytoplasma]